MGNPLLTEPLYFLWQHPLYVHQWFDLTQYLKIFLQTSGSEPVHEDFPCMAKYLPPESKSKTIRASQILGFPKEWGGPPARWMAYDWEQTMKMDDDWGYPHELETPI